MSKPDFKNMTTEEAVDYCYRHRNQWIGDMHPDDDPFEQWECLINQVEDGYIKPTELPDYGMDYGMDYEENDDE